MKHVWCVSKNIMTFRLKQIFTHKAKILVNIYITYILRKLIQMDYCKKQKLFFLFNMKHYFTECSISKIFLLGNPAYIFNKFSTDQLPYERSSKGAAQNRTVTWLEKIVWQRSSQNDSRQWMHSRCTCNLHWYNWGGISCQNPFTRKFYSMPLW